MVLYPALTAILSIAGGLLGYKVSVSADPDGVHEYWLAVGIGTLMQIPIAAIAANRRDRLAMGDHPARILNVRVSSAVLLAAALSVMAGAVHFWRPRPLLGYLALLMAAVALQQTSYTRASWQQVRDPNVFWRVQLTGAVVRLTGVSTLVVGLGLSYSGILVANLTAAAAICLSHGQWPGMGLMRLARLRRVWRAGGHRMLTLDGALRSGKAVFEGVAINASALVGEGTAGLPAAAAQSLLASVGYVGTLAVAMRQLGAGWERGSRTAIEPASLTLVLLGVGASAMGLQVAWGAFDVLLPSSSTESRIQIVAACATYLCVYPATRGYLYLDYAAPAALREFAVRLLSWYLLALLCGVMALHLLGQASVPLMAAITPLALAFALRGRHA